MKYVQLGNVLVAFHYETTDTQVKKNSVSFSVKKKQTTCKIFNEKEELLSTGVVKLHHEERDEKVLGRHYAFKKAMATIELTKAEKKAIWDDYRDNLNSPAKRRENSSANEIEEEYENSLEEYAQPTVDV